MTTEQLAALRCYLVTDARVGSAERLIEICQAAISGGMTTVQLRVKGWTDKQLLDAASALAPICHASGALLIVNDRVDIALAVGADGVHLGVDDLPVGAARRLLGPDALIGYSPETPEDRIQAERDGASYLGVGPVYGTTTKDDAGAAIGLDGIRAAVDVSPLPVVGIGGIGVDTARPVIDAGAVGVALVGAVFLSDDPHAAAARLAGALG